MLHSILELYKELADNMVTFYNLKNPVAEICYILCIHCMYAEVIINELASG